MSSRRQRVLFIIPTLTGGGAERVVVTLLQHLDRARIEPALAVVDTRHAAFRAEVPADVDFIDLGCTRVLHALPRLARLIWQRRPDSVLSTLGHLNLALAMLRPMLPDTTRYLARETTVLSQGLGEHTFPRGWAYGYRRYYRRFDRVICQSQAMRDDLVAHFRVSPGQTTVINNPLDLERITRTATEPLPPDAPQVQRGLPAPAPVHLVTAGRLVLQKGFDLMIEAIAMAHNTRLHLTVLGDGPERARLEALTHARGLSSRVRFAGFQANPYAYFARADGFVLSSQYEGFPNVVLEALACGTPVIALPAPGGLREIVGPVKGCVLAAEMTAAALSTALDGWSPVRIPPAAVTRYALAPIVARYASELSAFGAA
jgi:glycosyltransferase involved in cell wall biosynthesis